VSKTEASRSGTGISFSSWTNSSAILLTASHPPNVLSTIHHPSPTQFPAVASKGDISRATTSRLIAVAIFVTTTLAFTVLL
jgi:hypothetical protein